MKEKKWIFFLAIIWGGMDLGDLAKDRNNFGVMNIGVA